MTHSALLRIAIRRAAGSTHTWAIHEHLSRAPLRKCGRSPARGPLSTFEALRHDECVPPPREAQRRRDSAWRPARGTGNLGTRDAPRMTRLKGRRGPLASCGPERATDMMGALLRHAAPARAQTAQATHSPPLAPLRVCRCGARGAGSEHGALRCSHLSTALVLLCRRSRLSEARAGPCELPRSVAVLRHAPQGRAGACHNQCL